MHTGRADSGCGKEMKHLKQQQQQQLNGNGTTIMSIRTNGGTNTAGDRV
jgi:hypothetical protein